MLIQGTAVVGTVLALTAHLPDIVPEPTPEPQHSVWDHLADCEANGEWDSRAHPLYQGGLQFHPGTWDAYRDNDMPGHAADATRAQQIVVAERVLSEQGWEAWPACSRKLGLR